MSAFLNPSFYLIFFSYRGIAQKFKTEGWPSLVAQMVKNLPAVQETQV